MLMKGPLPIFLIILGLAVIGFGMMQKHRLETDLARPDTTVEIPQDRAFTHYFVIGAVIMVAGIAGVAFRGRS
jgi:hypothetical protein